MRRPELFGIELEQGRDVSFKAKNRKLSDVSKKFQLPPIPALQVPVPPLPTLPKFTLNLDATPMTDALDRLANKLTEVGKLHPIEPVLDDFDVEES